MSICKSKTQQQFNILAVRKLLCNSVNVVKHAWVYVFDKQIS